VYFGDDYKQLPEADTVDEIIVPELIIIHTDGQTANLPQNWNTDSTYHGLGEWYSVHFAVSQYDILQMLPMYTNGVLHGSGAAPQYNDQGEWVTYNNRSIHIEMAGHDYNALIAGWANPEMKQAITKTTDKATDLVVSLLWYYQIDPANVLGHYQVGRGKADPGNLYFEQYFLPQLQEKWEALQKSLEFRQRAHNLFDKRLFGSNIYSLSETNHTHPLNLPESIIINHLWKHNPLS